VEPVLVSSSDSEQKSFGASYQFPGVTDVLLTHKGQSLLPEISGRAVEISFPLQELPPAYRAGDHANLTAGWSASLNASPLSAPKNPSNSKLHPSSETYPQETDALYLLARRLQWEQEEEPSAAWDLIAAAESANLNTRAHARALLSGSRHLSGLGCANKPKRSFATETDKNMKVPYGLDIIENCSDCMITRSGFFCGLSSSAMQSLNQVSHKSVLPVGAILFVEGQSSRGMFILCSGRVDLSTTSREGKILILKTASDGEALGLSAAISGSSYESTAETATPCQLDFVETKHFLELMQEHSEIGVHAARSLSRDFQSAYRDIHDLVLTRSSAGKLARLLLSQSPTQGVEVAETRIHALMTHEEMAQRIGSSRETVTRLLSNLKKKQLIRLDGPTLVIRDRSALEALAV
jgi:CRP/FNR family cyclic AMP-dependent transcriptional regulator